MGVAYGIYYLSKKNEDGVSLLDEILDDPEDFAEKAKNYALQQAVQVVKDRI